MNHSYDDVVIPNNNNITKLTSLNDCAKHIIDIAREPKMNMAIQKLSYLILMIV